MTTSACGSSSGSSLVGGRRRGRCGRRRSARRRSPRACGRCVRPMSPAPTTRTFAPTRLAWVRGVQRPASCSRTKKGSPRWAASVAVTAHSAVDGRVRAAGVAEGDASGSRPAKRSAPALSSWTTRRSGSAAKNSASGRSAPPERGTQTRDRAASPVGGPSSADHRCARTRGETASTAAARAREGTRTSSTSSAPTSGSLTGSDTRRKHPLRPRRRTYCGRHAAGTAGALLVTAVLLAGCGSDGYEPSGPFRPLPEGAPPEVGPTAVVGAGAGPAGRSRCRASRRATPTWSPPGSPCRPGWRCCPTAARSWPSGTPAASCRCSPTAPPPAS